MRTTAKQTSILRFFTKKLLHNSKETNLFMDVAKKFQGCRSDLKHLQNKHKHNIKSKEKTYVWLQPKTYIS